MYGFSRRDGGFGRRQYVPRTWANACNTGWPGGYIFVKRGQAVPEGFVRTGFTEAIPGVRGGFPTNRHCYPQTGRGGVGEPPGGSLAAAINFARTEALRLTQEAQRDALRAAPRIGGTTISEQNAFALRYAEDVCTPYFCAFDGDSWATSGNRSVLKGRGRLEEFNRKGFRLVPLDMLRVREKLGVEPTPAQLLGACGSEEFQIQSSKLRFNRGEWLSKGRTALEQATQPRGAKRLALRDGAAPRPAEPGQPRELSPSGFEVGSRVFAGKPANALGAAQYYDGPYILGMDGYWSSRGGGVFATAAEAHAKCVC